LPANLAKITISHPYKLFPDHGHEI
jgi:hypothetical protein